MRDTLKSVHIHVIMWDRTGGDPGMAPGLREGEGVPGCP